MVLQAGEEVVRVDEGGRNTRERKCGSQEREREILMVRFSALPRCWLSTRELRTSFLAGLVMSSLYGANTVLSSRNPWLDIYIPVRVPIEK